MARGHQLELGIRTLELAFDFPRSTSQDLCRLLQTEHQIEVSERTVRRTLKTLQGMSYVLPYKSAGKELWRATGKIVPNLRTTLTY